VEEVSGARGAAAVRGGGELLARPLTEARCGAALPTPTGIDEVDRCLGGGLTAGSVTLLGGEPGVGKSTLTLQLAAAVAGRGAAVMLVAGEESPTQIAARADRLGTIPERLSVVDDCSVEAIIAGREELRPQIAVVDSIQTVRVDDIDGSAGSVVQLKAATERLVAAAKRLRVSVILVGHLTKDGSLAGPRVIEHMVDTVLSFAGDRSGGLRYLRPVKHRFGPTTEVGLFEMTAGGLVAVDDPSDRFLCDRQAGLAGSVIVPTIEGRRAILVEVQALTVDVAPNGGRARVQGVEQRRLEMVSAVLARRAGCPLARYDVFVSSTGGTAVREPAADLGLAVALVSSLVDRPVAPHLVVCGEVGLGGELRSVPQIEPRLHESFRLGFRTALVPASAPDGPTGLRVLRASNLGEALALCSLTPTG
jgi:DNA repair protein RadA/Sms